MTVKQKVAILGGGMAGLAAAFELSHTPELQSRYEVTVYQMGWRLGGKGASGRNLDADKHARIEEHGLHIWLGNYVNAFRVMRECYDVCRDASLTPNSPFRDWSDAFKPQHLITQMEQINGDWIPWNIHMPGNDRVPGDGDQCLSIVGMVRQILELVQGVIQPAPGPAARRFAGESPDVATALRLATELQAEEKGKKPLSPDKLRALQSELSNTQTRQLFRARPLGQTTEQRRRGILIDLALTIARGVVTDVLLRGHDSFDVLDGLDFRAWLAFHNADPASIDSAPVLSAYEIVFGYARGEEATPDFAAGVAVRFLLRWVLTYNGALIFKMQAGMGDIVFTPLYQVLKHRGVKFKFFERVKSLHLAADRKSVARVRMGRQVNLLVSDYEPLEEINGVLCWPTAPRYTGQIDPNDQQQIEALQANFPGLEPLESAFSPWSDRAEYELNVGIDFDHVVLAISLGALPIHCAELIAAEPRFAAMTQGVKTVATQSFQLWLNKDADELGWHSAEPAILDSYRNSWADFSHLIPREQFPSGDVKNIAYLCRALAEPPVTPVPGPAPQFEADQHERVRLWSRDSFLNGPEGMRPIWKNAYETSGAQDFRWPFLVDTRPTPGNGSDRFDAQFWTANVNPTDRYVQALTGTTQFRLRANESGFTNVALAGDWTRNGINAGCIEAATTGGMQAARAISGKPDPIPGETDFCLGRGGCGCSACSGCGCLAPILGPVQSLIDWVRGWLCPSTSKSPCLPTKPLYIDRNGEQAFPPPLVFENVEVTAYVLDADRAALRAMCDRYLNAACAETRFVPVIGKVLLMSVNNQRCFPTNAKFDFGFLSERDITFFVPFLSFRRSATGFFDNLRIVWFQPYMFVDHPWAIATGREVFGFQKSWSEFVPLLNAVDDKEFSVNTFGSSVIGTMQQVPMSKVLEVRRRGANTNLRSWGVGESLLAFRFLRDHLFEADEIQVDEIPTSLRLDDLLNWDMARMVMLKQFRDLADPSLACYRSVVESPMRLLNFHGGSLVSGNFEVEAAELRTHPILSDFGWSQSPRPVSLAMSLRMDFGFDSGEEIP